MVTVHTGQVPREPLKRYNYTLSEANIQLELLEVSMGTDGLVSRETTEDHNQLLHKEVC